MIDVNKSKIQIIVYMPRIILIKLQIFIVKSYTIFLLCKLNFLFAYCTIYKYASLMYPIIIIIYLIYCNKYYLL